MGLGFEGSGGVAHLLIMACAVRSVCCVDLLSISELNLSQCCLYIFHKTFNRSQVAA